MFELTPGSPLRWLKVDYQNTRFSEPLETDEQGGFRSEVQRFELDNKQVREPGLAVFLPQRWPFSEVVYAQVSDVHLEGGLGLRFSRGRMILEGRALYQVEMESGEKDSRYLPIRGVMSLSPAFRKRLESIQNPPQELPQGESSGDREEVLKILHERVGDWGKPLVLEALGNLKAGIPMTEDLLRGLRHRMYKSNMRDEADMFRTASLKPSPKRVAHRYSSLRLG
jgi:hypothetical protein